MVKKCDVFRTEVGFHENENENGDSFQLTSISTHPYGSALELRGLVIYPGERIR